MTLFDLISLLQWPRGIYILKYFIYLFLDRGEGREKERERNINVWLPLTHPKLGNLPCNPGMCLGWELNRWPFALQARAQSTEPHQPGPEVYFFKDGSNGQAGWVLLNSLLPSGHLLPSSTGSLFPSCGCLPSPEPALFGPRFRSYDSIYTLNRAAPHNTQNLAQLRAYYPLSPFFSISLYF